MAGKRDTPAMRQYSAFKERYPECVLFFRMGDFYEMFDDDAVAVSKALGLTLTQRTEGVPMAGVPYHQLETYLKRALDAGFRVAVCEQVQDPREAKGVVERAVTRVVTPGTLVDESLLADDAANVLAAVSFLDAGDGASCRVGVAAIELSTGGFVLSDTTAGELADELSRLGAVGEMLYAATSSGDAPPRVERALSGLGLSGTPRPGWEFRASGGLETLCAQYGVSTLAGFGLADDDPALGAAGAAVAYLRETQAIGEAASNADEGRRSRTLAHLRPPRRESDGRYLRIDAPSLRALEVESTVLGGDQSRSLAGVFSGGAIGCRTAMGRRLVRAWLRRPLAERGAIEARHACVATLVADARTERSLRESLAGVQDVARIGARLALGRATPRDLVGLGGSLSRLDAVSGAISGAPAFAGHAERLASVRGPLAPVAGLIGERCVEEAPAHLRDGGLIRDGVDAELDEARSLKRDSGAWLASYQKRLAEEHGVPGLKVGFNKVHGSYIELPRGQASRAPASFERRQTLKNAERYTTPELREYETRVTSADERAAARERALFDGLCDAARGVIAAAAAFGDVVAELDALCCFARRAAAGGWARPEMDDEPVLDVRDGRHPVLDLMLGEGFVPNDAALGAGGCDERLALITGPNMAGKSTFIRQTALLVLLAQAGSFVPASSARIGVADRLFTRIGADDALHRGQSTFMVEMTETASILHHATARSLVVLDEIGRGTSTLDGLSLAWAIAERLASAGGPRTLFATHYHELTEIAERMPGRVRNLHVAVREWNDEVVFLHRIVPGAASRSYGIHVAKLAGLPGDVVDRARELLETLAVSERALGVQTGAGLANGAGDGGQIALFGGAEHPVVGALRELKLESMTPLEAFDQLRRLRADAAPRGQDG